MTAKIEGEEKTEAGAAIGTVSTAVKGAIAAHGAASGAETAPMTARSVQGLADAPPITPRRKKPTRARRWRRRLIAMGLMVSVGAGAAIYWKEIKEKVTAYVDPKVSAGVGDIQTYTAKRGELRITMVEEGKLRAVNNYQIRMGTQGKITWLAEAGSRVKKGDKLASLDTQNQEQQLRSFQTQLETYQSQLAQAERQLPIAKANGAAAVATAKTALENAKLALKQYTTLDVRKKLNDLDTAVSDAQNKLLDQQKKRSDLQTQLSEMMNEGTEKDTLVNNINVAKQTEASLKRALTGALDQRTLYRTYTYPQDLKAKQRAVDNAELDLLKAQTNADNEYLQRQGEISRNTASIAQYKQYITRYESEIAKATATAPADGLVFYGSPDNDRYGISPEQIKVGADWYYSGPIMTIPDLSAFQVAVPVAEVYRGRVNVGVPATVTIDAVPGLVLQGKLTSISSVSRPKIQYDNTSPSVYDAVIALDVADERMVAGMTVRVEIVTAKLEEVLYVPVEAVFNEEGKTAAFMWVEGTEGGKLGHIEKRPVLTGQANDHFVEIKEGVKEGDKLLMSRPPTFVTPRNYRELADAMFPATEPASGPGTGAAATGAGTRGAMGMAGAASAPATGPGAARGRGRGMEMAAGPGTTPATRGAVAVEGRGATAGPAVREQVNTRPAGVTTAPSAAAGSAASQPG